jgi:hypothetical protein
MDIETASATLRRVVNLTKFSKRSAVSFRTLCRIKAGAKKVNASTLALLAKDLQRVKPEMRPAAEEAAEAKAEA